MVDDDDADEVEILKRLDKQLASERSTLEMYDTLYEGEQPLNYMAPELLDELGDRLQQVVLNWPQLVADSVEERLDLEGFRLAGETGTDQDLWRAWQANGMDAGAQQAHLDALVMGRSYAAVGAGDDGADPVITVESPLEMIHETDPRTRKVIRVAKIYEDTSGSDDLTRATLHLPDARSYWIKDGDAWVPDDEQDRDDHGLGVVTVAPLINRPRLRQRQTQGKGLSVGRSELHAVMPLSNAACKILTDMMVAAEFHAVPRRWALGFKQSDFEDRNGNQISAFKRAIGRVWSTEASAKEGAEVGQFPEASLSNFHETVKLLGQLVISLSGLPAPYLGQSSDNPASADAWRASETRLVKRAERKQQFFGEPWEDTQRHYLLIKSGSVPEEALAMETIWRDASTPTVAQAADAALKKFQSGIIPLRQTREDLGYSQTQIQRMEADDAAAAKAGRTPELITP